MSEETESRTINQRGILLVMSMEDPEEGSAKDSLCPLDNPDRSSSFSDLASAVHTRYQRQSGRMMIT